MDRKRDGNMDRKRDINKGLEQGPGTGTGGKGPVTRTGKGTRT